MMLNDPNMGGWQGVWPITSAARKPDTSSNTKFTSTRAPSRKTDIISPRFLPSRALLLCRHHTLWGEILESIVTLSLVRDQNGRPSHISSSPRPTAEDCSRRRRNSKLRPLPLAKTARQQGNSKA
jgi:hypothetical protein